MLMHVIVLFWMLFVSSATSFLVHSHRTSRSWKLSSHDQQKGIPSRFDTCRVLVSGMVGTEPKAMHLKNGHYVVNFALAVVGHFKPIHELEYFKPAEAMWISVELWDDLARDYAQVRRGSMVHGVGYMVQNKWIDKLNGEERKMYKMRLTKIMSSDEFSHITSIFEETVGDKKHTERSRCITDADSSFSNEAPVEPDQTVHTHKAVDSFAATGISIPRFSSINNHLSSINGFVSGGSSNMNSMNQHNEVVVGSSEKLSPTDGVKALWGKILSESKQACASIRGKIDE